MTEEEMQCRIALANDIFNSLMKLNQEFLSAINQNKWEWLLSFDLFRVLFYLGKMTSFEHKCLLILDALRDNIGFRENYELLTDFNKLLNDFKPIFIKYVAFGKVRSNETPEDLFEIYTYGGKV